MNNNLPVGWKLNKIKEYFELVNDKIEPTETSSLVYVGLEHLAKGGGIESTGDSDSLKSTKTVFQNGDVLYGKLRPYLNKHAFVAFDGVCSTDILVFRAKNVSSAKYLNYFLGTNEVLNYANENSQGINLPRVSGKIMGELAIPLPPLAEQKRIVAKLDAAFAHLDTLEQSLERIPELLKKFRQTVLSHAVTGKLTEDWREENSVGLTDDLIKQVVEKRYERMGSSYKKSRSLKEENLKINLRKDLDLFVIPRTWSWVNLGFLVDENDYFCYGVVQPEDEAADGNKLIRVKDLYNGKVEHEELRSISQEIDMVYKRSKVKEGDILISLVGTIGRTAIVSESESGYNIARALGKIPILDFNSNYVKIFLDSSIAQQWLLGDAREVARKTLNLEQLKSLPVALPPLAEQQEIVACVEGLLAQADALQTRYEALKALIDKLPGALLAKAFRGQLVPQDATEVPVPSAPQPSAEAPARRGPGQQQGLDF